MGGHNRKGKAFRTEKVGKCACDFDRRYISLDFFSLNLLLVSVYLSSLCFGVYVTEKFACLSFVIMLYDVLIGKMGEI
jgi:hypothetical protein